MTLENEALAARFASEAIDRLKQGQDGRSLTWELHNGVVIACEPIPQSYMQALREAMPMPAPPLVPIPGKDREEENPDDPTYKRTLDEWAELFGVARAKLIVAMATSLAFCPDNFPRPESDDWIAKVRRAEKFTRKPIDLELDDPDMRYYSWLRFFAVDNESDLRILLDLPQYLGGLRETEVAAALEAFRDLTTRAADKPSEASFGSRNGDSSNRAARRRNSRV